MMSQCHILIILYLNLNIMNFVLFKDAVIYLTNQIDLDKKPVFRDLTHIGLKQIVFSAAYTVVQNIKIYQIVLPVPNATVFCPTHTRTAKTIYLFYICLYIGEKTHSSSQKRQWKEFVKLLYIYIYTILSLVLVGALMGI